MFVKKDHQKQRFTKENVSDQAEDEEEKVEVSTKTRGRSNPMETRLKEAFEMKADLERSQRKFAFNRGSEKQERDWEDESLQDWQTVGQNGKKSSWAAKKDPNTSRL